MRFSRIAGSILLIIGAAGLPLVSPPVASAASYSLTVTKTSGGSVSSIPAGISCGWDCSQSYVAGTTVTLTATTNAGYKFTGWSGACTGTTPCSVTMNAAKSVKASFVVIPKYTLTISPRPSGGSVTSNPTGISCGYTCSKGFAEGTIVTLTATPSSGKVLTAWGGACSGNQPTCAVTMSAAKTVSATFGARPTTTVPTTTVPTTTVLTTTTTVPPTTTTSVQTTTTTTTTAASTYTLTVVKTGTGPGWIEGPGIRCTATCTATFAPGTDVKLFARYEPYGIYKYLYPASNGPGYCCDLSPFTVKMDSSKTFEVVFNQADPPPLVISASGDGYGTISSDAGHNCPASYCSIAAPPIGTVVTVVAHPAPGTVFIRHDGGTCTSDTNPACTLQVTVTPKQNLWCGGCTPGNVWTWSNDHDLGYFCIENGDCGLAPL